MELDQIIMDLGAPRQEALQPRTPEHWESLVTPTTSPFPKEEPETSQDTPLLDLPMTATLSNQPKTSTTTLMEGILNKFRSSVLMPFKDLQKETHVTIRQLKCQAISLDNLLGRMHRRLPGLSPPRKHVTHPVAAQPSSSAPSRETTSTPRRSTPYAISSRRALHLSARPSLLSQPGDERIRPPTRQHPG